MTENLPVFFWFGEIPGLEPILLPAISNVEARVFTSGDFRKGQFFVGGQNFAGFLARDNLLAKAPGNEEYPEKPYGTKVRFGHFIIAQKFISQRERRIKSGNVFLMNSKHQRPL